MKKEGCVKNFGDGRLNICELVTKLQVVKRLQTIESSQYIKSTSLETKYLSNPQANLLLMLINIQLPEAVLSQ